MGTELVAMSKREMERLEVVRRVAEGRLTQAKAGKFIGLSERQVRRLCAAFEERGPAGLVSGKRGQPSNRRLPDELRSRAIEIVRERYTDFGRCHVQIRFSLADIRSLGDELGRHTDRQLGRQYQLVELEGFLRLIRWQAPE